jgi:hypothetical protein
MNSRLSAIEKRIKQINGLAGYSFEDKKRLLSYAFPASNAKNRKYGVTVWQIKKGHYRFQADCILDDKLFGEFYKSDEGWVSDGIYSGKSNIGLSIQEYPWIKIAGVCAEENSVGRDYSFGLNHSFICLTK